jgi:hypothetical protein
MKLTSVIILLICLFTSTFSQWILIACFDLNENFIKKEFCINKNNPGSDCNGHCYLNKELNKEEKSNNPFNTSSKEKFEIQVFCIDASNNLNIFSSVIKRLYPVGQNFTPQEFLQSAFHPPSMA